MPYPQFDRQAVKMMPLSARLNKVKIERDHIPIDSSPQGLSPTAKKTIGVAVEQIVAARRSGAPVMLSFGATQSFSSCR